MRGFCSFVRDQLSSGRRACLWLSPLFPRSAHLPPHPSLTVQMTAAYYSYIGLWVPSAHVCIPPNAAPSGGEGTSLWLPTTSAPPWHSTPGTKVKVGPPSGEGARRSEGPHLYGLRLPPLSRQHACGFLGA